MLQIFIRSDSHHATFQRSYRVESISGIRTFSTCEVWVLATVYGRPAARGSRLKWEPLPPLNAVYLCGCERDGAGAGIEHENRCKHGIIYLFGLFGFPFFFCVGEKHISDLPFVVVYRVGVV